MAGWPAPSAAGRASRVHDDFPNLAGRSPSYLARQINDFKQMTHAWARER